MTRSIRDEQNAVINAFAARKPEGVKVWDFGGSTTVMPVPDSGSGSYLTTTLCVLYLEGPDKKMLEGKLLPRQDREVVDYGNGWKFSGVEFFQTTTAIELLEKLNNAKEKLLGR
jgi:hypothetical protein